MMLLFYLFFCYFFNIVKEIKGFILLMFFLEDIKYELEDFSIEDCMYFRNFF